jgi:hypothetical protein
MSRNCWAALGKHSSDDARVRMLRVLYVELRVIMDSRSSGTGESERCVRVKVVSNSNWGAGAPKDEVELR